MTGEAIAPAASIRMTTHRPELEKRPANFVPLSPVSFLAHAADFFGERLAVVHGARRFTYREFYARARRLAHALSKAGVQRGDTVSILASNIPAMLEAHYAAPMIGAVLNPINIRLDAPLIAFCLQHGGAKLLLADREFHASIAPALAKLGASAPIVVDIADAETEGAPRFGSVEYEDFIADGDPAVRLRWPRGRVGQHLPALHVGHHRRSQGRRLQPSWRLPRGARQRADLQARPREPLPVDAADVPLLGLDVHLGRDGGRRHPRVPAQSRAEAHLRCHCRASRHAHVRRADRAQHAGARARRGQAAAARAHQGGDRRRSTAGDRHRAHGGDGLRGAAPVRHHGELWAVHLLRTDGRMGRPADRGTLRADGAPGHSQSADRAHDRRRSGQHGSRCRAMAARWANSCWPATR